MENKEKWLLTDEEKNAYSDALAAELPTLRTMAGVTQDELAELIGVSRQTYGSIERGKRRMMWTTYLALVLFFDYNISTHDAIRKLSAFPRETFAKINDRSASYSDELVLFREAAVEKVRDMLDEQALHSIHTTIMVEYARCNNLSGEAVVKAFDGKRFTDSTEKDIIITRSLKNISRKQKNNHEDIRKG